MKLFLINIICGATLLISCKPHQLRVKIYNRTTYDMLSFNGKLGDSIITIDTLRAGETSNYFTTNYTYSIFSASTIVENDTLYHKISDYIGEKYYEKGKLKFILYIPQDKHKNARKQLRMKAKRIWF